MGEEDEEAEDEEEKADQEEDGDGKRMIVARMADEWRKGRREGGRRRKEGRPRDGANPRHLSAEHCIRFLCHEADVFPNQT